MTHCGSSNLTHSVTFPGGEWSSAHVLRTLWREGNKGSYCFDSHSDRKILFSDACLKITIPQNTVMLLIWHHKNNLGQRQATDHCPSLGHRDLTEQPPLTSTASLLDHLIHITHTSSPAGIKIKQLLLLVSVVWGLYLLLHKVISIELICTTTLRDNLEGTAGF